MASGTAMGALELGINIDPSNAAYGNPAPAELTKLGAGLVRIEYKDTSPAGQPPSPSAVAFYKKSAAGMAGASLRVLMILDYSSMPGRPDPGADNATWAAFTAAFAARCGAVAQAMAPHVAAYEVWNEPDLAHVGNVPASRFGPLLRSAYTAIRAGAGAPTPTVVMGGLASGDPSYVAATREAAGGGDLPCDAVGVHPYGQRPTPDWPSPTWGFGVLPDLLKRYYATEPKPLWITEVGTRDMNAQGAFPNRTFASVAQNLEPSGVCATVM